MTEQISDWSCNRVATLIKVHVTETNSFSLPFNQTLIHMCIGLFMYPALASQLLEAIINPVDRITGNFFSEEIKIKPLTFVPQNYPLNGSSCHPSFAPNIWQQRDNINSELSWAISELQYHTLEHNSSDWKTNQIQLNFFPTLPFIDMW